MRFYAILSSMNKATEKKEKTPEKNPIDKYDPGKIEPHWQSVWESEKIYQPDLQSAKDGFYNLNMFPYPSAEGLHVGNMYAFTGGDIYGRFQRMQGKSVFEPIGLDGFGIHSENYALKVGSHPMDQAAKSEQNFYRQLHSIGNSYDWSRTVETYKPEYYKWTQWVFTQLFKAGLAYRAGAEVNWCPSCKTVLADEQVIQKETEGSKETQETKVTIGVCERCDTPVEKRNLEQWFFRITEYADRLLQDLEKIEWPQKVKTAQRNWIGKSTGATVRFPLAKKYHFVLLHGFGGSAQGNFFPWIKKELESEGHTVEVLDLPNTDHPQEAEQVDYVLEHSKLDQNTILFGHSLGSVVAMKVLEKLDHPIAGLVVSGTFIEPKFKDHSREFESTFTWEFNGEKIRENIGFARVIHDLSDSAIFEESSRDVAALLGADLQLVTAKSEHFDADVEPAILKNIIPSLEVFTTRPDTLHGATFMVISPEHPLVDEILRSAQNDKVKMVVEEYIKINQSKTERERMEEAKKKTGVFSGLYAINPVNDQQIPIWIADYVLMGYGTGAIMAVPAHDQRDFEFAKKYDLPIKHVIMPSRIDPVNPPQEGKENTKRDGVLVVVKNPEEDTYLILNWKDQPWHTFITGGIEEGENYIEAARREIREETGYVNVKFIREMGGPTEAFFYAAHKGVNRQTSAHLMYFELENQERKDIANEERNRYEILWLTKSEADKVKLRHSETDLIWERIETGNDSYAGPGVLINSGSWDGWKTPEAKSEATKWLEEKGFGKEKVQYHLRDWLISRQRYWGAPIPMIYCEKCAEEGKSWFTTQEGKVRVSGISNVVSGKDDKEQNTKYQILNTEAAGWYPEVNLPVELPYIDDYRPVGTGKAPLANHPEFYETTCPGCEGPARRETDVADTFLDSGWYFLRYPATDLESIPFPMAAEAAKTVILNDSEGSQQQNNRVSSPLAQIDSEVDKAEKRTAWLPVDQYIGGAEHSVLHLLYSRFIYKVFTDLGYIDAKSGGDQPASLREALLAGEPFPKFFAHGLIIKEGAKMSKSKGNVVVPDEYIRKYGADTLRTYLMFLGPFSDGGDFQDAGIAGVNKFLKRVWHLFTTKEIAGNLVESSAKSAMHRTIKGITQDISTFRYNTAIAKIMTWYNELSDRESISREEIVVFLKLLAPFAPHMTEELWQRFQLSVLSSQLSDSSQPVYRSTGQLTTEKQDSENRKLKTDNWTSIHVSDWPQYDESLLVSDTVTIAVQVNGKLRDTLLIKAEKATDQASVEIEARQSEKVKKFIEGKEIRKVIYVPGKVLNLVV
jgi:leucyl-tRNA synthetase